MPELPRVFIFPGTMNWLDPDFANRCPGLKARRLPKKVGMENATPFPPNHLNFETKGLLGKETGKGTASP